MRISNPRVLLVLFVLATAGGFVATHAWQSPPAIEPPAGPARPVAVLDRWLNLSSAQAAQLQDVDPDYAGERAALERELAAARERLAALFEDAATPDDELLAQVEAVIDTQAALERRVARYLLDIRPHLTDAQRRTLFERCADGVREAGRWRWRRGQDGRAGGGPPWRDDDARVAPDDTRGGGRRDGPRGRGGPPWSDDEAGRRGGGPGGRGGGAGRGDDRPRTEGP